VTKLTGYTIPFDPNPTNTKGSQNDAVLKGNIQQTSSSNCVVHTPSQPTGSPHYGYIHHLHYSGLGHVTATDWCRPVLVWFTTRWAVDLLPLQTETRSIPTAGLCCRAPSPKYLVTHCEHAVFQFANTNTGTHVIPASSFPFRHVTRLHMAVLNIPMQGTISFYTLQHS
jgi:hypothetical protein